MKELLHLVRLMREWTETRGPAPAHKVTEWADAIVAACAPVGWGIQSELTTIRNALIESRETAMRYTLLARIPECGHFGGIAQNLDYICSAMLAVASAAPPAPGAEKVDPKVWHDHYYQAFMRWLEDDSTHWINDKDAAWQAWIYLHEEGLTTYPEAAMSREAQG